MKARTFHHGLAGLLLAGLVLAWAAWAEEGETPDFLIPGPTGWGWLRVGGQDHDLDEMLSLLRPPGAETLAIFAPAKIWKPFYDKVYGRVPIDLARYATLYSLPSGDSGPPSLSDWPFFYQENPAEAEAADPNQPLHPPPGEPLLPPSSTAVTFKTSIASTGEYGRHKENTASKTTYTMVTSLILTRRQVFFLNLLQTDPADAAELERLALAWREEFLESRAGGESPE
jgi:hypothetical protein